jgi:6-phosphogluconolactonase/glucosamine-6-phosphate isomerase/deaminase
MIKFIKIIDDLPVVDYLAQVLQQHLEAGEKVLWLLSGGSAITVEVAVARRLAAAPNLRNLTVSLTDERYGEVGHPDSNWMQLINGGLVIAEADLVPVLHGQYRPATAKAFEEFLSDQFTAADYSIAVLGIGPDGHTSGIKPHSTAVTSQDLVCAYDGDDYSRITTTSKALARLDEIVVYAVGPAKHQQLEHLEHDLPVDEQPAQILKQLKQVTMFNDLKGGAL